MYFSLLVGCVVLCYDESKLHMYTASFFFFKQKTAYEMRISDWSSDVCSSDLQTCPSTGEIVDQALIVGQDLARPGEELLALRREPGEAMASRHERYAEILLKFADRRRQGRLGDMAGIGGAGEMPLFGERHEIGEMADEHFDPLAEHRSEEHTTELQSLMRISYAVFCLKKQRTTNYNIILTN